MITRVAGRAVDDRRRGGEAVARPSRSGPSWTSISTTSGCRSRPAARPRRRPPAWPTTVEIGLEFEQGGQRLADHRLVVDQQRRGSSARPGGRSRACPRNRHGFAAAAPRWSPPTSGRAARTGARLGCTSSVPPAAATRAASPSRPEPAVAPHDPDAVVGHAHLVRGHRDRAGLRLAVPDHVGHRLAHHVAEQLADLVAERRQRSGQPRPRCLRPGAPSARRPPRWRARTSRIADAVARTSARACRAISVTSAICSPGRDRIGPRPAGPASSDLIEIAVSEWPRMSCRSRLIRSRSATTASAVDPLLGAASAGRQIRPDSIPPPRARRGDQSRSARYTGSPGCSETSADDRPATTPQTEDHDPGLPPRDEHRRPASRRRPRSTTKSQPPGQRTPPRPGPRSRRRTTQRRTSDGRSTQADEHVRRSAISQHQADPQDQDRA